MPARLVMTCAILATLLLVPNSDADADGPTPGQLDRDAGRYAVTTQKAFGDVLEDVEFAIGQHNYRITGRNHIGKAIAERSGQPGPDAVIVHFCNIDTAQKVYAANPGYLLHMPCRIAIRQTPDTVVIESRLVPENDPALRELAREINRMMRAIADYGAK